MIDRLKRAIGWAWEYRQRWRHVLTIEQKRCPFCNEGFFVKTPTVGRLACSSCGAIGLAGHVVTK